MPTASFSIQVSTAPSAEVMPETRGYHMEIKRAFSPALVRREITRAARAGFNVVMFPVYINGETLFPCESSREIGLSPITPQFRKWDPLAVALETAHAFGVHLWGFARVYNFNSRYAVGPHWLLRRRLDWRVEIHPDQRRSPLRDREAYLACPVNPAYRRHLGNMMTELVTAYPIDGLVLNYTGFPLRRGPLDMHPYCYCQSCCVRYREESDGDLIEDARHDEKSEKLRRWRAEAANSGLEHLRHRVIKSRRTLRFMARTHPQWRWSMEDSGPFVQAPLAMDWSALLNSGSVEELIIDHDGETAPELFSARLVSDLANLHDDALLVPALQVIHPQDFAEPLAAVRKYPVAGFMAEFADPLTDADADFIRENYLNETAQSPDHSPLLAVAFLLHRAQARHQDNPLFADFMRDFLRLIGAQLRQGMSFEPLEIMLDNLSGLQDAIRRGRLGDYRVPESTLRDLGLARRIVRIACLDVRS